MSAFGARPIGVRGFGDFLPGTAATVVTPSNQTVEVTLAADDSAIYGPAFTQVLAVGGIADSSAVYAPNVYEPNIIYVNTIPSATGVVIGPRIDQTGVAAADYLPRIQVGIGTPGYGTYTVLLDGAFAKSWQERLNEAGTGTFTLQNDDVQIGLVTYDTKIVFLLDGYIVFAMKVEKMVRRSVDQGEEHDQTTVFSGRSIIGDLERAIVAPALGIDRLVYGDTRCFNFASIDFDDSAWDLATATLYAPVSGNPGDPLLPVETWAYPSGWPTSASQWIWSQYGGYTGTPAGDCYFRQTISISVKTNAEIWAAADDSYEVWLDGSLVMSTVGLSFFSNMQHTKVVLDVGDHIIAFRLTNLNAERAGLIFSVLELNDQGEVTSTLAFSADNATRCLGYPPNPPGFTPGEVVRHLMQEAQARGALPVFLRSFTDETDSLGNAWPSTSEITVQHGSDLLTVIRQLAETYFDFSTFFAEEVLDLYTSLDFGSSVTYTPGVNVSSLTHEMTA